MSYAWYACADCCFGSNSPRNAVNHNAETGHTIVKEEDDK